MRDPITQNSPTAGSEIRNEYDERITASEMLAVIMVRHGNEAGFSSIWLTDNHAEPGPYGLARHRIEQKAVMNFNSSASRSRGIRKRQTAFVRSERRRFGRSGM